MHEATVIGVDGGGTRTRVVLSTSRGEVVGYGVSGPSSLDGVGLEVAARNLGDAVNAAWADARAVPRPVDASFWGVAGVVSDRDRERLRAVVDSLQVSAPGSVGVDHDIRISLAGGLGNVPGIALIVGTGCSCYARNAAGESVRVGGWGHLMDDAGSSYFLGVEALKAVVRSADGRAAPTSLTDPVLRHFGIGDIQDLMNRVHADGAQKRGIASLASLVLAEAQVGDERATEIVTRAFSELALLVEVASRRLAFEDDAVRLAVSGGLAQSGDFFREGLHRAIRARVPGVEIQAPILPPVLGAVLLALEMVDGRPSSAFIPALLQSSVHHMAEAAQ